MGINGIEDVLMINQVFCDSKGWTQKLITRKDRSKGCIMFTFVTYESFLLFGTSKRGV